ncbi:Protocadherin beta-9 [Schistosoma japonicum]|uniref:Protocadherin beta-9 n=1 Tax=Schistosoma japonicum TaxID=6182 RepID=A0A4Z2CZX0_SCHJA|nr:Protocadherin beta-9 [Schistosoma japonicum]
MIIVQHGISIKNGLNYNNDHNNYTTNNNYGRIPNILVQISEITNNAQLMHGIENHLGLQQRYPQSQQQLQSRTTLPRAYDPDEGVNSQLTYHLQSITKSSDIYKHDNQLNNYNDEYIPFILEDIPNGPLELVSTVNLDYEQKQNYEFYLLAIDSGLPQRTGTALIKVNIIDVNDHSPIFTQTVFYPSSGAISEKTIPGTMILNLSAIDEDASSVNNRIRYAMIPGTIAMNYFNVQSNGMIILKRWLDYETMETSSTDDQIMLNSVLLNTPAPLTSFDVGSNNNNNNQNYRKQFIFQVKAIDSAPQPYELTSTAMVVIPVIDENDEAPMITVKFLGSSEMTSHGETGVVKENVQPPIQLAYVQVRDPDFNGNDHVNCILTDNVNFSLKPTNSLDQFHEIDNQLKLQSSVLSSMSLSQSTSRNDYILNLITKPDREKNPLYYVRIKCIDEASNFNEQTISLRVLDMNDEQPRFQKSIYRFDLPENSDKQMKPSRYYRMDDISNTYTINQTTLLEKENVNERKEDKGEENDDHYEYRIGRVLAEDNDQGENARVEYYLDEYFLEIRSSVSSVIPSAYLLINKQTRVEDKNLFIYHNENSNTNDHRHEVIRVDQLFRIDSHTGMLYALKKFDGENVNMFRFNVFALDQPNQVTSIRHSGTAIIEIKITDVNDWPPLFILTNQSNVNTTDTMEHIVTSLSDSSTISKNKHISDIFQSENLTVDNQNELHFVNNYVFHVKENRPAYWLIGRIMAIDLDIESKAMTYNNLNKISHSSSTSSTPSTKTSFVSSLSYITLKIASDSPLEIRRTFNLHATNGYLRTTISLDREKRNMYTFNVIAYDGNPSTLTSQTSTATVTVIVEDENDNDPVFIRPATSTKRSTHSSTSSSKSKFDVIKSEFINNIHKSNSIDSIVNYKKENDLQTKQYNKLNVNWPTSNDDYNNDIKQINPGGISNNPNNIMQQSAQFSDKSNIPVVLVHRRENNPDLTDGQDKMSSLSESRPLLQIEATDADIDENGKITYEIGAGNTDNVFFLNPDTGILSLSPNLYSQSNQFIPASSQTTNINQNAINKLNHIVYMLRFEACDHGIPKRCASPIWVQLVIDPNEFPHLIQLSHSNPSSMNSHDTFNNPSYSIDQQSNGYIEQAGTVMLSNHINSNTNTNSNNIGLNKQISGDLYKDNVSLNNNMELNKRFPPKSVQFKNFWNMKSLLDHQQHNKNVRNQYPLLQQQQQQQQYLSDSNVGKHSSNTQYYPFGHDDRYLSNSNNNNNKKNNHSNSFIISEVAIVCLVIVFIILLIAIMILVYLTRRKALLLSSVTTAKPKVKDNNFQSNSNSCNLKYNQNNSETVCTPIELSRNTASFYRTLPNSMMDVNKMACNYDLSVGSIENSLTLSTDMLQNPIDPHPLIHGNSEPRLLFNTTLNGPTPQPTLLTSQLQNNLNESTYSPQCVLNSIHPCYNAEHEYQSLAPTINNRIVHASRCLTPFFEQRTHHINHNIESIGLNHIRSSCHSWLPVNSLENMNHQSTIYNESAMNNKEHDQISSPKSPALVYAIPLNSNKHPVHFRGNSLPVYPVNQFQQDPTNLKSFQHRFQPQREEYQNQQYSLSSYQDISLLQATLRRHNRQSLIMNTQTNPMFNHGHRIHHNTNRLICSKSQNHYKTFHSKQHEDGHLTSPRITFADNLKVCQPNKTNHFRHHQHQVSSGIRDEQECQQLLTVNRNNVDENNDYICNDIVISSDHHKQSVKTDDSHTDNENNIKHIHIATTADQLNEMPIYIQSSMNSHQMVSNPTTTLINYHGNIPHNKETDYIDDTNCNSKTEDTFNQLQYSPTVSTSLPVLIDINQMIDDTSHSKKLTNSQKYDLQSASINNVLSRSNACKYSYKAYREASFV